MSFSFREVYLLHLVEMQELKLTDYFKNLTYNGKDYLYREGMKVLDNELHMKVEYPTPKIDIYTVHKLMYSRGHYLSIYEQKYRVIKIQLSEVSIIYTSSPLYEQLKVNNEFSSRCNLLYRGTECGYKDSTFYTVNNEVTTDSSLDVCAHTLKACHTRFGDKPLPTTGFDITNS